MKIAYSGRKQVEISRAAQHAESRNSLHNREDVPSLQ